MATPFENLVARRVSGDHGCELIVDNEREDTKSRPAQKRRVRAERRSAGATDPTLGDIIDQPSFYHSL